MPKNTPDNFFWLREYKLRASIFSAWALNQLRSKSMDSTDENRVLPLLLLKAKLNT